MVHRHFTSLTSLVVSIHSWEWSIIDIMILPLLSQLARKLRTLKLYLNPIVKQAEIMRPFDRRLCTVNFPSTSPCPRVGACFCDYGNIAFFFYTSGMKLIFFIFLLLGRNEKIASDQKWRTTVHNSLLAFINGSLLSLEHLTLDLNVPELTTFFFMPPFPLYLPVLSRLRQFHFRSGITYELMHDSLVNYAMPNAKLEQLTVLNLDSAPIVVTIGK